MATIQNERTPTLDTDLFLRLWDKQQLTPTLARHVLKLGFDDSDDARMRDLAKKNANGEITRSELAELDEFLRVGTVLSLLQSRARQRLRHEKSVRNGR